MVQYINAETFKYDEASFGKDGFLKQELLRGEVPGVETNYFAVKKGCTFNSTVEPDRIRVILFKEGTGYVKVNGSTITLSESAAFCPPPGASFAVNAGAENVEFLEILYRLTAEEMKELPVLKKKEPYFQNYSNCTTYKEAIKSEKTINRTLIPEGVVPRLCMGSVETTGPDDVGAHAHPMLEQFFLGLWENCCLAKADEAEMLFHENTLLHIPLGSMHGVRVEEGHKLHYLWIDLFSDADMSYIHETHIQNNV